MPSCDCFKVSETFREDFSSSMWRISKVLLVNMGNKEALKLRVHTALIFITYDTMPKALDHTIPAILSEISENTYGKNQGIRKR